MNGETYPDVQCCVANMEEKPPATFSDDHAAGAVPGVVVAALCGAGFM